MRKPKPTNHDSTQNKHPVGRFTGSRWSGRYWEGGCTCGSGIEGREFYDGRGIYCGITCRSCCHELSYRPEIMDRHYDENDVDEPIEPDE